MKNSIKEMFHQKCNQDKNYQEILKKIEPKRKFKFQYSYAVIPLCTFLLGIMVWTKVQPDKELQTDLPKDQIYVNLYEGEIDKEINNLPELQDWVWLGQTIDDPVLPRKYDWLKFIEMPEDLNIKNSEGFYLQEELRGYTVYYNDSENNGRYFNIAFGTNGNIPPTRGFIYTTYQWFMLEAKVSYINNIPVKIIKNYDNYFVTFEYKDMVFDISAQVEQEELIDALKSLFKWKGFYYEIEDKVDNFTKNIWDWLFIFGFQV